MMPGMGYKNYIYLTWVVSAAAMKYNIQPLYEYLNKSIFSTDLGMFTVFTCITGLALAFFSASVSDGLLRFVQTSSRNSFTTFLVAGIFLLGFITALDITVSVVTESDTFMVQSLMDIIKDPSDYTQLFVANGTDTVNNSTILE
jgi:hypothetical protein